MIRFNSDYLEGAHPRILEKLASTNMAQTPGYGEDMFCDKARDTIRRETPGAEIVIEYTRPDLHGEPLCEDITMVLRFLQTETEERKEPC